MAETTQNGQGLSGTSALELICGNCFCPLAWDTSNAVRPPIAESWIQSKIFRRYLVGLYREGEVLITIAGLLLTTPVLVESYLQPMDLACTLSQTLHIRLARCMFDFLNLGIPQGSLAPQLIAAHLIL